jgi:hypothetical protein
MWLLGVILNLAHNYGRPGDLGGKTQEVEVAKHLGFKMVQSKQKLAHKQDKPRALRKRFHYVQAQQYQKW